jgi:phage FluMu protein gp41
MPSNVKITTRTTKLDGLDIKVFTEKTLRNSGGTHSIPSTVEKGLLLLNRQSFNVVGVATRRISVYWKFIIVIIIEKTIPLKT